MYRAHFPFVNNVSAGHFFPQPYFSSLLLFFSIIPGRIIEMHEMHRRIQELNIFGHNSAQIYDAINNKLNEVRIYTGRNNL